MPYSKNIQTVLAILQNEADGDVSAALLKMTKDYNMTWMYQGHDELFPSTTNDVEEELQEVYPIQGRTYDIRNIAEGENVVMIEMVESYPDPETGQMYRTPQVIIVEFENELIRTGRHYTDPRLSYMELPEETIATALRDTKTKIIITSESK